MVRKIGLIIGVFIVLSLIMPLDSVRGASATVQVSPLTSTVGSGAVFSVNLTVTGVVNLGVWEFRLFYLSSVLNCTGAVKGSFLESGGHSQFFTFTLYPLFNATHGCILLGASLVGNVTGVNGSGTLATVTFQALSAGDTPLHFDSDPTWSFLLDSSPPPRNPIPYTAADGIVHVTSTAFHDVAIINVSSPKKIIFLGFTGNVTTTVADLGNYSENVNVTVRTLNVTDGTTKVIGTFTNVPISNGTSTDLILSWNTTGSAKGNYTLVAGADPVLGETNTLNNNFTDSWVMVTMIGDITGNSPFVPDGKCDIRDIAVVAKGFGSSPGLPGWNPNCDVNNDNKIDIKDIALVAKHFGEADP